MFFFFLTNDITVGKKSAGGDFQNISLRIMTYADTSEHQFTTNH